jgi:hypothetical protein
MATPIRISEKLTCGGSPGSDQVAVVPAFFLKPIEPLLCLQLQVTCFFYNLAANN